MKFQENKVFNLRLAAKPLDGMLIRPGETFSFWQEVRYADKHVAYKEGLTVIDGKMMTTSGGGLCQMSNLLFELFLHSPLDIVERKGHGKKEFPDPGTSLAGVDATISEGWIDLKVKNNTEDTFQIGIRLDEEKIYGFLRTDAKNQATYKVFNHRLQYLRENGKVFQRASVYRQKVCGEIEDRERKLYENCCEIEYALPDHVIIEEEINK